MTCIASAENETRRVEIYIDGDSESPREWSNVGTFITWHRGYGSPDKHHFPTPSDFIDWWEGKGECDNCGQEVHVRDDGRWTHDRSDDVHCQPWEGCHDATPDAIIVIDADGTEHDATKATVQWDTTGTRHGEGGVLLDVYLYTHSGVIYKATESGNPFHTPWDSGQVGYIYATADVLDREWGKPDVPEVVGDRKAMCINVLRGEVEVYSDWANGSVYGYITYERKGDDWDEVDSCWGFYGYDPSENGMTDQAGDEFADLLREAS